MPMSRLAAGTAEMSLPSISTSPASANSKPATIRSAVVLPQPDGPSSATSSPGAMSSDMSSSALTVAPNTRVRLRSETLVPPPRAAPVAPATPVTAGAAAVSFGGLSRCPRSRWWASVSYRLGERAPR